MSKGEYAGPAGTHHCPVQAVDVGIADVLQQSVDGAADFIVAVGAGERKCGPGASGRFPSCDRYDSHSRKQASGCWKHRLLLYQVIGGNTTALACQHNPAASRGDNERV